MVLKCALNNICNTVTSGQGPSSSGGPLRSARKKPGRGICLTSQSKHILTSVRSYFEEEKQPGKSLMKNRPLDRTATATGISKATIKRIYQTMAEDKEIFTPTNNTLNQELQLTLLIGQRSYTMDCTQFSCILYLAIYTSSFIINLCILHLATYTSSLFVH